MTGGEIYASLTEGDWTQIVRQTLAETSNDKNDFELCLKMACIAGAVKATKAGAEEKEQDIAPHTSDSKKLSDKAYLDQKSKEMKLGYVVQEVMRTIEMFDGTQSWPVWRANAENRMEGMTDEAKVEYIRSKLSGIYRHKCDIINANVTVYAEFMKNLDKAMKNIPDKLSGMNEINAYPLWGDTDKPLQTYFIEYNLWINYMSSFVLR